MDRIVDVQGPVSKPDNFSIQFLFQVLRTYSELYLQFLELKLRYFSIDNAHRMYNVHPNIFVIPFEV
jgi:hypothetical protein